MFIDFLSYNYDTWSCKLVYILIVILLVLAYFPHYVNRIELPANATLQ